MKAIQGYHLIKPENPSWRHQPMNNVRSNKKELSPKQREELLSALKARFEKNLNRHKGLVWAKVQAKLEASAEKLWSLHEMERTGVTTARSLTMPSEASVAR